MLVKGQSQSQHQILVAVVFGLQVFHEVFKAREVVVVVLQAGFHRAVQRGNLGRKGVERRKHRAQRVALAGIQVPRGPRHLAAFVAMPVTYTLN